MPSTNIFNTSVTTTNSRFSTVNQTITPCLFFIPSKLNPSYPSPSYTCFWANVCFYINLFITTVEVNEFLNYLHNIKNCETGPWNYIGPFHLISTPSPLWISFSEGTWLLQEFLRGYYVLFVFWRVQG